MAGFFVAQNVAAASSLILTDDGTVYLIENGARRGFPTLSVFYSHGYTLSQIQKATTADAGLPTGTVMSYADGSFILVRDGTVYLIEGGQKRGFTSAAAFLEKGYSFAKVLPDQAGVIDTVTAGSVINSISASPSPAPIVSGPQIKVLYPNGGEKIALGTKNLIKWKQTGISAVTIGFKQCDTCFDTIVTSLAVDPNAAEGEYLWVVPTNLLLAAGYKIEVKGYNNAAPAAADASDANFNLVAGTQITLSASLDAASPSAARYIGGTKNVEFARIRYHSLGGDMTLNQVKLVSTSSEARNLFAKIHVYEGSKWLGTAFDLENLSISPVVIVNGASAVLTLTADLKSGTSGSLRLGLVVNNTEDYGETMAIAASGSFSIELDSATPVSRDVTGGAKDIVAAVFKITAKDEDVSVQSLGLHVDPMDFKAITKVSVWDGSAKVGELSGLRGSVKFASPVAVTQGIGKQLAVKLSFAEVDGIDIKNNGTVRVSLDLANLSNTKAVGMVSGQEMLPTSSFSTVGPLLTIVNSPSELLGDVNYDRIVSESDAELINLHASGKSLLAGQALTNAEVTGDGKINGIDESLASQYAKLLIGSFPKIDGSILVLGDANRDARITPSDTAAIDNHISGAKILLGRALDNADVDGDGQVTASDSKAVSDYSEGKIESFSRSSKVAGITQQNQPPSIPTVNGFQDIIYLNIPQKIWGFSFDPDEDPVSYEIWWGDGTKYFSLVLPHRYAFFAEHTWTARGRYQIVVKAGDGRGGFGVTSFYIWVR